MFTDDRLGLLFACCHPALPMAGRVALTLKTVAGCRPARSPAPSWSARRPWASVCCAPRPRSPTPASRCGCPEPHRLRRPGGGCARGHLPPLQRGLLRDRGRPTPCATTWPRRPSGWPIWSASCCPTTARCTGSARCCCCSTPGAARGPTPPATWSPWKIRTGRAGTGPRSAPASTAWPSAARPEGAPGYYAPPGRDRGRPRPADTADRHRLARIVAAYDALLGLRPSPVIALNRAVALGFRDGPEPGCKPWRLSRARRARRLPWLAGGPRRPAAAGRPCRGLGAELPGSHRAVPYRPRATLARTPAAGTHMSGRSANCTAATATVPSAAISSEARAGR